MGISIAEYKSTETGEIVEGIHTLTGIPSDKKERAKVLQNVANAAKSKGAELIRRDDGKRAWVAKNAKLAQQVRDENPIKNRGRKRSDKYDALVTF